MFTAGCMKREAPKPEEVTEAPDTTESHTIKSNCTSNHTLYNRCKGGGRCVVETKKHDGSETTYCV